MASVHGSRRGSRRGVTGEYLRELRRRLPFALGHRRRVLAEVREHLREAGDGADERFGSIEAIVVPLREELRVLAAARASWLVPVLVACSVGPLYVLPENVFPPAPWDVKPGYLAWKQDVVIAAFLVAVALSLAGWAVGRIRPRFAMVPLAGSLLALGVSVAFAWITGIQWIEAVPGTSTVVVYAVIIPASAALLAAVTVVLAEAL